MTPAFVGYSSEKPALGELVRDAWGQSYTASADLLPGARYTYELISADAYREHFELDPDGKGFQTYILGNYLRD